MASPQGSHHHAQRTSAVIRGPEVRFFKKSAGAFNTYPAAPSTADRAPDHMDNTVHTEARSYRGTSSDAAGKTPSAAAEDTGVDSEAKPTIAEDDFPLEKLKLMLVTTSDDDRRSPGLLGSGSAVVSVSPASVISGMDDGPFTFPEGEASLSKSRGSPVQRLLRLTGTRGGSLRFFFNDLIDEGSGGVGGCAQGERDHFGGGRKPAASSLRECPVSGSQRMIVLPTKGVRG